MLGLSGLLATGLVVSISAAGTDSLLPESVRPVPQWLAGPFGATGLGLSVGVLIGVMTLMFISYAVAVQAADRLSARSVLMTIAALHALVLLAPPLVSTDVFSYQAYARMGSMYGANPYLHGPSAIAPRSGVSVHRRQMGVHADRVRAGVHGSELHAGIRLDRRQRACLQGDRSALESRDRRDRVEHGAPFAASTR